MLYLKTHWTQFSYGYIASDIWLRTAQINWEETHFHCTMVHSFWSAARDLLHAPTHKEDSTYHAWSVLNQFVTPVCYTSLLHQFVTPVCYTSLLHQFVSSVCYIHQLVTQVCYTWLQHTSICCTSLLHTRVCYTSLLHQFVTYTN